MPPAPRHPYEADRLASLRSYRVLDTPPDPALDAVTAAVAAALHAPAALVSFVDEDRQWFKSRFGVDLTETSRDLSFCAHAVAAERPLVVPDASRDPRFADHPMVTMDAGIRFYAGVPLIGRDGLPLGALCVLDSEARPDAADTLPILEPLARTVVELLELRRLEAAAGLAARDLLGESRQLRHAIEHGDLTVAYQPVVSLPDPRIEGVEALVRWQHPQLGLRPPAAFLPVAEASGLVVPLGRFVLGAACRQVQAWRSAVPAAAGLGVAVNVSGRQLTAPDLVASVEAALASSGLPPTALTLELTETALAETDPQADRSLARLRALGVVLALDDFGTGYSTLAYLQRFEPDVVKLDRRFVQALGRSERDDLLAGSVVDVALRLGCEVVAEGIEEPEQAEAVARLGCTHAQGYLFSPPVPPEQLFAASTAWSPGAVPR